MAKTKVKQYDVVFRSELGSIGLLFDGNTLIGIDYLEKAREKSAKDTIAKTVKKNIENYLDPKSRVKTIKVKTRLHVTAFQEKVLTQLQKIPYGETRTYGDIARILNTSPRAVGNACRRNPLPIIIPCHRVVAATGIGGYDGAKSGDLLDIKRQLLAREGVLFDSE